MEGMDLFEYSKSLQEKSDEALVEMLKLGRDAYSEGIHDLILAEFRRRNLSENLIKKDVRKEQEEIKEIPPTEKFVTIALFDIPGVAQIYKEALNNERIFCFIPNDYAPFDGQYYYIPNPLDRGIKLQVAEKDVQKAIEILDEDPACRKYILYPEDYPKPRYPKELNNEKETEQYPRIKKGERIIIIYRRVVFFLILAYFLSLIIVNIVRRFLK